MVTPASTPVSVSHERNRLATAHDQPFPFDRIRVPLLNIHGEDDYPAVQRLAAQLEPLLAQLNTRSAQRRIPGAGHYFNGHEAELSVVISDWLETLFPQDN